MPTIFHDELQSMIMMHKVTCEYLFQFDELTLETSELDGFYLLSDKLNVLSLRNYCPRLTLLMSYSTMYQSVPKLMHLKITHHSHTIYFVLY